MQPLAPGPWNPGGLPLQEQVCEPALTTVLRPQQQSTSSRAGHRELSSPLHSQIRESGIPAPMEDPHPLPNSEALGPWEVPMSTL